jgi:hypothetical protein
LPALVPGDVAAPVAASVPGDVVVAAPVAASVPGDVVAPVPAPTAAAPVASLQDPSKSVQSEMVLQINQLKVAEINIKC